MPSFAGTVQLGVRGVWGNVAWGINRPCSSCVVIRSEDHKRNKMLSSVIIVLVGLNCVAIASNLYVSSYNGNVDSLSVTETDSGLHLSLIDSNTACAPSPAWLTWDDANHVLYCLDEGLIRPNGSISSFQTSDTGSLYLSERRVIPSGPSAGVIYDSGGKNMLALSH